MTRGEPNEIEKDLVRNRVLAEVFDKPKLGKDTTSPANGRYRQIAAPPCIARPIVVTFTYFKIPGKVKANRAGNRFSFDIQQAAYGNDILVDRAHHPANCQLRP